METYYRKGVMGSDGNGQQDRGRLSFQRYSSGSIAIFVRLQQSSQQSFYSEQIVGWDDKCI